MNRTLYGRKPRPDYTIEVVEREALPVVVVTMAILCSCVLAGALLHCCAGVPL